MIRASRRRNWPVGFLLAAFAAGCQPLPHPFAADRPSAALIAVPDNFDIAVGQVAGDPRATADKLPKAVAQELVKHNIAASDETASKISYQLSGRIEEHPDQPGQSVVTVLWQLRDPRGNIVNQRSDRLVAPTRDWADGNDAPVTQLAAASADGFAALTAVAQPATPKEAPGAGRTRVAVRKISGAPGDGDDSLASSLTAILRHEDIELVNAAKGKPDIDVDCDVKIDPIEGDKQHIKITWHIDRAAGGEIGQVAQENDVPRGRLNGAWGDVAYSVAMAAADGIMQIVNRGVPSPKQAPEATAAAVPPPTASVATPASISAADNKPPAAPPVAGNIDSPEVNLPTVNVGPSESSAAPGAASDTPTLLPYRGVPIPH